MGRHGLVRAGNWNEQRCFRPAADSSGNLYVGGNFTTAGGVTVNNIAKWDGTAWFALGTGTNSTVSALAADSSGNLYVGGNFTTADGIAANAT